MAVDARDVVSAVTVTVARSRTTSASYVTGKPFAGVPAPHEGTLLLVAVCARGASVVACQWAAHSVSTGVHTTLLCVCGGYDRARR